MSLLNKLKRIDPEDALSLAGHAVEVMGALANAANGSNAKDLIMAIRHIYEAVINAANGHITPDEAHHALTKFHQAISDNDRAADAAVIAKFGVVTDPPDRFETADTNPGKPDPPEDT